MLRDVSGGGVNVTYEDARKTMLWVYGKLMELSVAGLAEGDTQLTESGRVEYRSLVLSGFRPSEEMAMGALKELAGGSRDAAENLWLLIENMDAVAGGVNLG